MSSSRSRNSSISSNNSNSGSSKKLVALVTGASDGIGEITAIEYAKLGYKVAITGRNPGKLEKVLELLVANSPNKSRDDFLAMRTDFEDPVQVEPIVGRTVAKFGQLNILINNAGYAGMSRELGHPDFFEDFQKILQVNLVSATRIAQLASEHLKKTKGVIVNVSSIADRLAMPSISYSVSKAGLTMLTKSLANALEGSGIRVVGVAPGPILTNFAENIESFSTITSLLRAGEPKEVANLIVFLTSHKASYITGCTVDVDGGCYAKFGGIFNKPKQVQ